MHSFVAAPERWPHKCIECFYGGPDRDWYLDLGDVLDHPDPTVPTVYICSLCVKAIAKEKDLVDAGPLRTELDSAKAEAFDHKVRAEGLEQALDGLFRARLFNPDSPTSSGDVDEPPSGEVVAGNVRQEGVELDVGAGASAQPSDVPLLDGLRPTFAIDGDAVA